MFDSKIEFFCDPRCKGVIPEPYKAKKYIPKWYKRLPSKMQDNEGFSFSTLKRCPPFLDAMSAGWIIPLAADIEFKIQDDGTGVQWKSEFFFDMCESHGIDQIATHPKAPTVPLKFLNHWLIKTPPGWSCIFTPPLNRPDEHIDLISGVVETDKYFEFINFPGFLKKPTGNLLLEAGYHLMQVIPYKRGFSKDAKISTMTNKHLDKLKNTRDRRLSHNSLYRDTMWEHK